MVSSFILKERIERILPQYDYEYCGIKEIPNKTFDVIITFDMLKSAVLEVAPKGSRVLTVEEFQNFAQNALDKFLSEGTI